ncbi:HdeD family acid-resistance protein [Caulobacter sp.]|uniref:HdeD family acid-resistance protein n=1 Tax=Caulobacter sp. TaxID=78 RepID=UPI003BB1DFC3
MIVEPLSVVHLLARTWWLALLRGLAAILFGALVLLWPQLTLVSLVILYAVYALSDGMFALAEALRGGGLIPRWWLVVIGAGNLLTAAAALAWPALTAILLIILIGASAVTRGLFEIVGAVHLRKVIDNEWTLVASGTISVLFGIGVMLAPRAGAVALAWLIGLWAIALGLLIVVLALRLRRLRQALR